MSIALPEQAGYIESRASISLSEALQRWRQEARVGVCDTGRYRCRFFVWGSGQPVVFLHGISDQARCFVPLMAHLTDKFQCIAYELPTGMGDGANLSRITHADFVADLFALLDHLHCGQVCLYGASYGSTIVLKALHQQPQRFLRAVLQSGFAHLRMAPAEKLVARWMQRSRMRIRDLPLRESWQRRFDAPQFIGVPLDLWNFQVVNCGAAPVRAMAHRAWLLSKLDLRPILSQIRHRILLLHGDCDNVISQGTADELASGLPHADRLEFSECGHCMQYTHAAGVAEALRRFLLPPCGLIG
ncbi:MAG TPA: alpha/beta hydrolase [Gemmataceae bacterium]|jgi:pimeloyl-ACP methyl ester carboxylesterase|nr:alpha/beta hydrolase [Gemmataceae bacterium]